MGHLVRGTDIFVYFFSSMHLTTFPAQTCWKERPHPPSGQYLKNTRTQCNSVFPATVETLSGVCTRCFPGSFFLRDTSYVCVCFLIRPRSLSWEPSLSIMHKTTHHGAGSDRTPPWAPSTACVIDSASSETHWFLQLGSTASWHLLFQGRGLFSGSISIICTTTGGLAVSYAPLLAGGRWRGAQCSWMGIVSSHTRRLH